MRALHWTGALVGRPVVIGDVRLGVAVDALLDPALGRLVGFDVLCRDDAHRFLPFPACEVSDDRLEVESALVLIEREVDFYRAGGRALSDLRGEPVAVGGEEVGVLADLVIGRAGEVAAIAVATQTGDIAIEPGVGVAVGNRSLRPAV